MVHDGVFDFEENRDLVYRCRYLASATDRAAREVQLIEEIGLQ
jgi:hypothetical protein